MCPERAMETHHGAGDMGSKPSTPGGDPTVQCPGTEGIHAAYKQGDPSRARHLLREACDESISQLEKGQLLSISAAYGDLETVRYLLTERRVQLPTEPTDDNPAVVAAHFGHTDVVQELLESLPGDPEIWGIQLTIQTKGKLPANGGTASHTSLSLTHEVTAAPSGC